ncbi:AAA domain-containing protein [Cyclobacterium sediminis]
MANIGEELLYTTKLLRAEWAEDLAQFRSLTFRKSIKDKVQAGVCWYPVQLNKIKWTFSDQLVIEISVKEALSNHGFHSGKSISLFSNVEENDIQTTYLNGVVNNVKGNVMTLSLNTERLPDWVNEGGIGVNLMFDDTTYKVMTSTMEAVIASENNRLAHLKEVILGHRKPDFTTSTNRGSELLNEGQNKALKLIEQAKDLAIVHGPPGTGKTTTLVQAIVSATQKYDQVLVCAPSNAAVDLLVERMGDVNLDVLRIGHPARIDEKIIQRTLDAKILAHPSYKEYKKLRKAAEEYRRKANKFKRNFGHAEREKRKMNYNEAGKCQAEARQLYDYMTHSILGSCQVIACTLVGAASNLLKSKVFQVVFLDEAAQGLEPATWIPVTKAQKIVLAGDHCQLPPTIKSREAAKGLQNTLFEKAITNQPEAAQLLSVQYRMAAAIMGFSNLAFYDNKLIAAANTQKHYLEEGEASLAFVDTAGSGFLEFRDRETLSISNKEEAFMLLTLLRDLLKRVGLNKNENQAWQVGLIAPYSAQVRLLKEMVALDSEWLFLKQMDQNLTISTVDGFQGQERDIILISLTRSNEQGEIGFLADTRRMNVALTRAKRKLIVLGDSATIGSNDFYQSFLDFVQEQGAYHSIYEFMDQ